jgi:signal transduction histidine kinase
VRRIPWQLLATTVLLVLLATLAALQYRWLGEVSRAEEDRMRASLRTHATDLAREFDREITRTYVAFQLGPDDAVKDSAAALSAAYERWQAAPAAPSLLRGVYLLDGATFDGATLRRFDPATHTLAVVEWPTDLAASLKRPDRLLPHVVGAAPILTAEAVDARALALIVPVPQVSRARPDESLRVITDSATPVRAVIVQFDAAALTQQLLQPLVAKYFGNGDTSEYLVTIAKADDPAATIYSSAGGPVSLAAAEVTTGLFSIGLDQANRLAVAAALPPPGPDAKSLKTEHMAITIVRRSSGRDAARLFTIGNDGQGAWQLRARHRSGTLEAIVEGTRRRNLAISLGVLGLLGASLILVVAASRRQRRLALQQMEFVASVSHELRTPLAVIRSAAENLSDGVISEPTQVKTYGALIETEGRRLGDMVERVMEFAGFSAGASVRTRPDVDMSAVIADAVRGVSGDARDRGVTVAVHPNGALPLVTGDPDALRSAVQNIIGNAVKYSPDGATVDVAAHAEHGRIRIRVADRGLGIDAADLPHIFKPFFRGRRAVDAQVRGSGVGLTVARHVIDAHRATIHVESRAAEGTTVTIDLPANDAPASGPAH